MTHFEEQRLGNPDLVRTLRDVVQDPHTWLLVVIDETGLTFVSHCIAAVGREATQRCAALRMGRVTLLTFAKQDLSIQALNGILTQLGLGQHRQTNAERDIIGIASPDNRAAMTTLCQWLKDLRVERDAAARH